MTSEALHSVLNNVNYATVAVISVVAFFILERLFKFVFNEAKKSRNRRKREKKIMATIPEKTAAPVRDGRVSPPVKRTGVQTIPLPARGPDETIPLPARGPDGLSLLNFPVCPICKRRNTREKPFQIRWLPAENHYVCAGNHKFQKNGLPI